MAPSPPPQKSSPLVKAALVLAGSTGLLCIWLVARQTSPAARTVAAPPALEPVAAVETYVPPPAPPPLPAPEPAPVDVKEPAAPPAAAEKPVDQIPREKLEEALTTEADPARKLAIIRRLEKQPKPYTRYAVAVLFPDPDKRVRLEAIRVVEKLDSNNDVLLAKVRAVYLYEQDPDVKAQLDRIVQKYRPQEEAEARARAEAAAREGQALATPPN